MSRLSRLSLSALIVALVIGFSSSHVGALECSSVQNSHGVYDQRYGYYCAGTGPGCTYCWEEVIVQAP